VDRTTAFFASLAGGAAEITILGERFDRRSLESTPRHVAAVLANVAPALVVAAGCAALPRCASGPKSFS
jgi:uncharacterized membrane protein AbrB (regulator of aidB expression)